MNAVYRFSVVAGAVMIVAGLFVATTQADPAPDSPQAKQALHQNVQKVLAQMEQRDPQLKSLIDRSYGYAIFPSIAKGGLIVGGAYGKGEVYQGGQMVGYADLSQGSIGLEAGGKQFAELVLLQNKDDFLRLKNDNFTFGGNISAVVIEAGASASAHFQNGVAVFTMPQGGLMAEFSLTGQQINFQPIAVASAPTTRETR